jgi:hypothetical protein
VHTRPRSVLLRAPRHGRSRPAGGIHTQSAVRFAGRDVPQVALAGRHREGDIQLARICRLRGHPFPGRGPAVPPGYVGTESGIEALRHLRLRPPLQHRHQFGALPCSGACPGIGARRGAGSLRCRRATDTMISTWKVAVARVRTGQRERQRRASATQRPRKIGISLYSREPRCLNNLAASLGRTRRVEGMRYSTPLTDCRVARGGLGTARSRGSSGTNRRSAGLFNACSRTVQAARHSFLQIGSVADGSRETVERPLEAAHQTSGWGVVSFNSIARDTTMMKYDCRSDACPTTRCTCDSQNAVVTCHCGAECDCEACDCSDS